MYRKQVRRRRAVLVLLVIASLVLLSSHFSESSSGPLHSIQRGVATVLGPFEEGADRALKPARDSIDWFGDTFEARGENEDLQAEVEDLRDRVAEAESGIDEDDPVITGGGLVGRVTEMTSGTARVTLITDPRSAVSAKVLPDGPSGVITPEVGDPGELLLDFIEEDRVVDEGQMVVTAGWRSGNLTSLFPYGIEIGRVTEASLDEQQTYQGVHVRPFVDVREM